MSKQILTLILMLFAFTLGAQELKVTGTVTSQEDGEPLIGATITCKEARSNVTATDIDGNYQISVKPG